MAAEGQADGNKGEDSIDIEYRRSKGEDRGPPLCPSDEFQFSVLCFAEVRENRSHVAE